MITFSQTRTFFLTLSFAIEAQVWVNRFSSDSSRQLHPYLQNVSEATVDLQWVERVSVYP